MSKSKIEWCDRTWNPVIGCTPISPGCANCYAKRMAERFAGPWGLDPKDPFAVKYHPERINDPLRWRKPSKIFVCSMSDLFHEEVHGAWMFDVMLTISQAPEHTFLVLTKRADRMKTFMDAYYSHGHELLLNLWLGVTAEDQEQADKRIPILLQIPAAKRFVSVEPMLGPVDLTGYHHFEHPDNEGYGAAMISGLDWVICGGESGPDARPMHPEWARGLRDQCQAAGTPFLFKQWGEWAPFYDRDKDDPDWKNVPKESKQFCYVNLAGGHGFHGERLVYFQRVGKKAAGRLLDGELWDQYPEDLN